ncbi:transcriptional regulator with XRE-family HTH domain [Sphingomonas sp. UYAg733]
MLVAPAILKTYPADMQIDAIRQLGAAIRERRVDARLSQVAFAVRADLDRQYLSRLERGMQNPSMLVVMRIALELDVSPAELLRGVTLDPTELRAVKRLSRGPRPAQGVLKPE